MLERIKIRIFQIKRILSHYAGDTYDQLVGGAGRVCDCGAEADVGGESCWGETSRVERLHDDQNCDIFAIQLLKMLKAEIKVFSK